MTVDKHIRAPRSFLNALKDEALDKIALFANDGDKDRHYLVAESFLFTDHEISVLHEQQADNNLAEHLKSMIINRSDSVLKQLANNVPDLLNAWLNRNPALTEDNVAYQIYRGNTINRVLLIYHVRRIIDFVEKRQLNPNASGEEGLLHKPVGLSFHIDPYAQEGWLTRLQGSSL